jgi:DNA helicase-2/ATP-dependent DNA helicase PcrA
MNNNKLIIAAAGSGKTTCLVNEALKIKEGRILITTFTEANEDGIRRKFIEKNNFIPRNIEVQTWFSFLLQHGVKPYQGGLFDGDITGMVLESGQSARGTHESNIEKHYLSPTHKVYSDKLAKFAVQCNKKSNGEVLKRLSKIYTHIFIDEVQDLAGYDLVLLKFLFSSDINILLVGDPRQATYSTNNASKNSRYKKSQIIQFFEDSSFDIDTDKTSLTINYRCVQQICDLANKLYPEHSPSNSGNTNTSHHDGVFLVKPSDVDIYLKTFRPMQLRDSVRTEVNEHFDVYTFGKSKGLEFERILIYPTEPMRKWLENPALELAPTSRSKFYVALTRAVFSVGIIFDYDDNTSIDGTMKFVP